MPIGSVIAMPTNNREIHKLWVTRNRGASGICTSRLLNSSPKIGVTFARRTEETRQPKEATIAIIRAIASVGAWLGCFCSACIESSVSPFARGAAFDALFVFWSLEDGVHVEARRVYVVGIERAQLHEFFHLSDDVV